MLGASLTHTALYAVFAYSRQKHVGRVRLDAPHGEFNRHGRGPIVTLEHSQQHYRDTFKPVHSVSVKVSPPAVGNRLENYHEKELPTARPHHIKNSSLSQGSRFGRGTRKQTMLPANKFKRHHAKKEMLRRALTPAVRQPTWRWCDFQPTPSRLSNMSTS
ncbi:hypothetical protein LguiB_002942 [Lonicera macranthoides]